MVMRYLGGFNAPSYNPLASNVTTGANTVQQGGIYTSSSASQNIPLGQWVDDEFYNRTSLLLQADNFANGSQNNTFLDSSTNNFTVTRNGNATQGSFSPFSVPAGYWSNSFDNTTQAYIATPSTNIFNFGVGDFSFEVFANNTSTSWPAVWRFITTAQPFTVNGSTDGVVLIDLGSGGVSTGIVLPVNTWFHFVVTRQGNRVRAFLNGVLRYTVINSTNFTATGITYVGGFPGFAQTWPGYLSNLRVINGGVPTAYQTSSTTLGTTVFSTPINPLTTTSQGASGTFSFLTCQNNRFLDNGSTAQPLTPSASVSTKGISPFNNNVPQFNGPTGTASISFPGTADNAATFTGTTIPISQTNFTIECWVYITAANSGIWPCMVGDMVGGGGADINWTFGPRSNNKLSFQYRTGTGVYGPSTLRTTTALALNTWYYIAASCDANTLRLYIDGVQQSLDSGGDSYGIGARAETSGFTTVGSIPNGGAGNAFAGLISNLSITNGTAKYTGSTFTVPTGPLPAVATNQILLFASPFAVDSNATVAAKPVTITGALGNNVGTPFATPPVTFPNAGGSAYFDGTGDYLDVTGSSNLAFGPDNWTIELWVYPSNATGDKIIYDSRPASTNGLYPTIYQSSNTFKYFTSSADRITSAAVLVANAWHHVVVSRVSNTTRMFINGAVQSQTYTDTNSYLNGASRPRIGDSGVTVGAGFLGYVSDVRSLKNVGVTSVTVPTAPLLPIVNTQLLLSCTNAGISDATRLNSFETVGNAQVSTAIKKYGSGSMFFDGTGDWLLIPDSPELRLGLGDFTVEAWIYVSSFAGARSIIGKGTGSTGWFFYVATTGRLAFGYGSLTLNGNNALVLNTWNHVAVVRFGSSSTNVRMYINGMFDAAASIATDFNQTNNMYVGADRSAANNFFGYIDDLRVTKNFARYTANFVPPTVALPRMG